MNNNFTEIDLQCHLIEMIVNTTILANDPLHHKYYFDLIELEKSTVSLTEMIFKIISNLNSTLYNLNENSQQAVLIYAKNWLSKMRDLKKEILQVGHLDNKLYQIIHAYISDYIFEKNKTFLEEIIQLILGFINYEHPDKAKSIHLKVINDIRTEIVSVNFLSWKMLKDYILILEHVAFSKSILAKNTYELLDVYEILFLVLDKVDQINYSSIMKDIEIEIDTETQRNKGKLLSQICLSFCRVSSRLFDEFSKDEILKNIVYQQNNNNTTNGDGLESIFEKKNNSPAFFDSMIFITFVQRFLTIRSFLISAQNEKEDSIYLFSLPSDGVFLFELTPSKSILIELLSTICQKLFLNNLIENFDNFKKYITHITKVLIVSLGNLYKNRDPSLIPREKADNSLEEIIQMRAIVRTLELITVSCESSYGMSIFEDNKFDIFRYIILPNILITPLELAYFEFEPEEYAKHIYDMTLKAKTKLPKHKTYKLLEAMCEHLSGFLNFIVEFYIDVLFYVISQNDSTFIPKYNLSLDQGLIDYIKACPQEVLIEQALQVLASTSFLIWEKSNQRTLVEDRIDMINHLLIQMNNDFIKSKLCVFYSYTLDDMFHTHSQILSKSFDDSFTFLFQCSTDEKCKLSLNIVALEALNDLLFDPEMTKLSVEFVKIFAKDVLGLMGLSKTIPKFQEMVSSSLYHEFLEGLLKYYLNDIENDICLIFYFYWEDIKSYIQNMKPTTSSTKMIPLRERKAESTALNNLQAVKALIQTIISRSTDCNVKIGIYNEIMSQLPFLCKLVNNDYEGDFLELVRIVLNDIKLVPNEYLNILSSLLEKLNEGYDGKFESKIESYHIDFIFTFLQNMKESDIIILKYQEKIYDLISTRLQTILRKENIGKIIAEHNIFVNILLVYIFFFWNQLNLSELDEENHCLIIIKLITKRLGTLPNTDLTLNNHLIMAFFLSMLKLQISNQAHLLHKINLNLLITKALSFFPLSSCSLEEHSISAIFASNMISFLSLNYYTELSQFNEYENNPTIANWIKHLINYNIDELLYLHKCSAKWRQKKTEDNLIKSDTSDEDDYLQSLDIDTIFRHSYKYKHPHKETQRMLPEKKYEDKNDISFDYDMDDDEEIENDEKDSNEDQSDEDASYEDVDDIKESCENNDDKDDDFIKVKNCGEKEFQHYFNLMAHEDLKGLLNDTNEFELFDQVLESLKNQNEAFYDFVISHFKPSRVKLIASLRKFKKISKKGEPVIFRKIVKLKKK